MGVFDLHCAVSGLALTGRTTWVLLGESGAGAWEPMALPLEGDYDRYGAIDSIKPVTNLRLVESILSEVEWPAWARGDEPLSALASCAIEEVRVEWRGTRLSFSLIDGGVYRALARGADAGAAATDYDRRLRACLSAHPATVERYAALSDSKKATLMPWLAGFEQVRARVATLVPTDVHDSEQYVALEGDFGCAARVAEARRRFAGDAPVLAAIAANANDWDSYDEDDEDA